MDKREIVQEEATASILSNKFIGLLHVSPRVGKTKITLDALNTITKTELNILISAPKVPILDSWKEEIKKWGINSNIKITYVWSNSIKKINNRFDLIIADECHDYNLKVLSELRKHQIKGTRILGLSGSLDQSTLFHLENILSLKIIYNYPFEEAIKDQIIADYEITCIACELDDVEKNVLAGNNEKKFYQTEQEAYNYWDDRYKNDVELGKNKNLTFLSGRRMDVIYNSKSKIKKTLELVKNQQRCLIFTGRQQIADKIGEGSFHSKSNKNTLENFKNQKINKLSVVSMISMGITIPNLKVAIFNQLKSVESLCIQQTMRVMNLEGNSKAKIYIVYLKNTQDEIWMKSALRGFNKNKIKYI